MQRVQADSLCAPFPVLFHLCRLHWGLKGISLRRFAMAEPVFHPGCKGLLVHTVTGTTGTGPALQMGSWAATVLAPKAAPPNQARMPVGCSVEGMGGH